MENLSGPNLANASAIKDAANAKAMDLLVKFADRVKAIRDDEELDAYLTSIDYLEDELKTAFYNLRDRVGVMRAEEVVAEMLKVSPPPLS